MRGNKHILFRIMQNISHRFERQHDSRWWSLHIYKVSAVPSVTHLREIKDDLISIFGKIYVTRMPITYIFQCKIDREKKITTTFFHSLRRDFRSYPRIIRLAKKIL